MVSNSFLTKAAAAVVILFGAGHSSGYPWTPGESSAAKQVVASMQSVQFSAVGETRTYWDFYLGFGLNISVFLFTQGCTLWLLAPLAKENPSLHRKICALNALCFVIKGFLSWKFFFPPPMAFAIVIAALLTYVSIFSADNETTRKRE